MAENALIGALRVTLGLDSAAFEKGADRAIGKMDAMSKAGYLTGRSLRFVFDSAVSVAGAIAAAFTVQAVKQALDYAASIGEVATQIGVTTTELQAYRFAATQTNVTQAELEKSLSKLTLALGKAGTGAKKEAQTFEILGISIKDAEGNIRPTGEVFLEVADRIASITDPAKRAAAATAVFGEDARKLLPLLEGGADGLREFGRQAEEAGAIISEGDIAKADQTADKIDALVQQLKTDFSREVAQNADAIGDLAGALTGLLGVIARVGSAYVNFWKDAGAAAGRGLGTIAAYASYYTGIGRRDPNTAQTPFVRPTMASLFGTGGGAAPDLSKLNAPSPRRGGGGRQQRDRTEDFAYKLQELGKDVDQSFSRDFTPDAIKRADELREQLDDIAESARKAGVPMAQFSDKVAELKTRIAELETGALEREAEDFGDQVWKVARSVERLDAGSVTPLEARLGEVNDRYTDLQKRIRDQIEENEKLASVNSDAATQMQKLRDLLLQVTAAHEKATAAALSQYAAEQELRDLAAQQSAQQIGLDIQGLQRASGAAGVETPQQLEMRQIEEQLQAERLSALTQLREYEMQLADAKRENDVEEAARLTGLVDLQREYYGLVTETQAEQIVIQQRLQDAFSDFTNGLSNALFDMVTKFDFSLKSIGDVFLKLLNDVFLRPALDSLAGSASGFLSSLFAGGFATGGTIPRGQWGIVGENGPEPAFAGDAPLRVYPNETLGGGRGDQYNITVAGAMSDRDARRTGSQIAVGISKTQATKRKAGLAG